MIGASRAASTREYQVLSTTNITSTGTQDYTVPAGVVFLEVEMYGGGGGGGDGYQIMGRGGSQHTNGRGGGGGAYVKHRIRIADLRANDVIRVIVGAGGAEASNAFADGSDGGSTQLSKHLRGGSTITAFSSITAGGGEGGKSAGSFGFSSSGAGGVAQNGNLVNTNGEASAERTTSSSDLNGTAGGDAGGPDGGAGGNGATTTGSFGSSGTDGAAPGGGGGGGASTVATSGEGGANGKVIIKAFG